MNIKLETVAGSSPGKDPALAIKSSWVLATIMAVTGLIYLRCIGNEFVFDDLWMIRFNSYISQWSFLSRSLVNDSWWFKDPNHLPMSSYYRPLQDIWLGLNYQIFGFNPAGWHIAMVALHLVVVWLVYKIALQITFKQLTALFAAMLFALSPVHAEAIVWAAAIPFPLSATLMLGAFYLFIKRREAPIRNILLSTILDGLALLTHETAVVFPVLAATYVLLLEPVDIRRSSEYEVNVGLPTQSIAHDGYRPVVAVIPFVLVTLVYLAIRYSVIGALTYRAGQTTFASGRVVLLTIPWDFLHFIGLVLMPWNAGPAHNVSYVTELSSPKFWGSTIILCALAAALTIPRYLNRSLYAFCTLWFVILATPELNLISGFPFTFVQDRYLYLPSFGPYLAIAIAATSLVEEHGLLPALGFGAVGILTGVYTILLLNVQHLWHDDLTFFAYCATQTPKSPNIRQGLAVALVERDQLAAALNQLTTGIRLDPRNDDIWFDRGIVEAHLGNFSEAVRDIRVAITLKPNRPAINYASLANYADAAGQPKISQAALNECEKLEGGAELGNLTEAQIALRHGKADEAIAILAGMAAKYPRDTRVWSALGSARASKNDYVGALAAYQNVAVLAPDFSAGYFLSAQVLHQMGRDGDALENCRHALRINPGDPATLALIAQIHKSNLAAH